MPIDTRIHYLIVKPQSTKTACGIGIIAYYPMSNSAMTDEAGKDPIRVNVGKQGVDCPECKKKMKEEVK